MKRPRGYDAEAAERKRRRTIAVERSANPASLDVARLLQARAFEIKALEAAMRLAPSAGAQRAFQSLPRRLRRRAASHDVRRLPLRLRAKALIEVCPLPRPG